MKHRREGGVDDELVPTPTDGDGRDDQDHAPARTAGTTWGLAGAVLVLLVWGGAAVALVLGAAGNLERAEAVLPDARDAVADGDVRAATSALERAGTALSDAEANLTNPLVVPLRVLPIVGADLRAATAIAEGGAAVIRATSDAVATVESLPGGIDALRPSDGVLPVGALQRLAPHARDIADTSVVSLRGIEAEPGSGRVGRVTGGRERVLELLTPLTDQAETAALLAEQLPGFLGADGPRTYLFGASTPAELRGTGGFIGSISLLQVDEGRLEFGTFEAASDLPILAPDAIPAPEGANAARWSRYGGTGFWLTLNRTPHFPSEAQVMLEHWERSHGQAVDGMIVVDPFALEALLELAGPAQVPGYPVELDAGSVVAFVANEAYSIFDDEDERKAVLGAVAAATFDRFLTAGAAATEPTELVSALAGLGADGHLLLYATDAPTQATLSRAELTGELLDPDGDLVNVVLNSGSASKVDFYAERRIEHRARLLADGAARSELTITLGNDAPTSGQPAYIIGSDTETLDAGDALVDVSVYLAEGARFTEVPAPQDGLPTFTETERGQPVHDGWVRIPSRERVERNYTWETRDAWSTTADGVLEYELVFQGQTVIRPTDLTLRVEIPDGFELVDMPEGTELSGDTLTWFGPVRGEDVTLRVRLLPLGE